MKEKNISRIKDTEKIEKVLNIIKKYLNLISYDIRILKL